MRAGLAATVVASAAATLWGCVADVNEVRLVLPDDGALGLMCVDDDTGAGLIERAVRADGGAEFSVVLDYLGFDGVPSCRPTQILDWCRERGCPIRRRSCVELSVDGPLPEDPLEAQAAFVEALRNMGPLTRDAPDGIVMVRMVLTTERCADLESNQYQCDGLLGCVYSCPVPLDDVRGDVLLELDLLSDRCDETIVRICAGIGNEPDRCTR